MNEITRRTVKDAGGWFVLFLIIMNSDWIAPLFGHTHAGGIGLSQIVVAVLVLGWCIYRVIDNLILYNEWDKFED